MIETWENRYANSMQEAMQAEIDELRAELKKCREYGEQVLQSSVMWHDHATKRTAQIAELRAELAALKQQEPIAWLNNHRTIAFTRFDMDGFPEDIRAIYTTPLYLAPGAQPCDTPSYCKSVMRCTAMDEKRAWPAPDEQSAFELWLQITRPSGDVEDVHRQWESSADYADYMDACNPSAQPVPEGAQIDAMVNKFLQWKLPADFGPDCYISFDVIKALQWSWPTGANLFTATQARQMIEAMLESANDRPKETK